MADAGTGYRIEPLTVEHERDGFSSGKAPLDRFLHEQVFDWQRRRLTQAFVLVALGAPRVVLGYYTIGMTRIDASDLPPKLAMRMPRAAEIGAVLLGRLAVDRTIHGQGFGRDLLYDALDRAVAATDEIAAIAMVVDAIDEEAAGFYLRHGFIRFPVRQNRLFLELARHRALIRSGRV